MNNITIPQLIWLLCMMCWTIVLLVIRLRRGTRGWLFILLGIAGAAGSYLFIAPHMTTPFRMIGLASTVGMGIALLGLRKPKIRTDHCACGYDFRGETDQSSTRCPECGAGRPSMKGHCLECRADLRQAIAGGSIICPSCGAGIPGV